ncbi:alpha-N-acetylglucosaminidase C-terminal domain-containing protein [Bacteroides thetaiotaomicron]|nr:alpha-N-acetylglucosaminidase C-terminal domain-containing protein [Bacteroides thetaiotaomicron]MCS2207905.1 alpha-N-acetylglucosaminidase C-terminal domain-containing protein [Bacteroides thetaiotaomicron]
MEKQKLKKYYEENARCILTVWGQKGNGLNDYANRGWGGLTNVYYRERWKALLQQK